MTKYNPQKIERKWQSYWAKKKIYVAPSSPKATKGKAKRYVLVEFAYPSGAGLHMGHLRPYVAGDVYSRYLRMKGHEVMYPMGWDAFGLPAENYAIKHGVHPSKSTVENIKNSKRQTQSWGMSLDWSREVTTSDPNYYKWTQWIFLQLFKAGLAYEATGLINWCPKDKTGLAKEEVIDGKCERCGTAVEKKEMRQWYLKITAYAEKLLAGLKNLDWPESVKVQQENWIGRSEGALIRFSIAPQPTLTIRRGAVAGEIEVFTTRPDTIFGATFLVIAPEHELLSRLNLDIDEEIRAYCEQAKHKTLLRRQETKEKTGIEIRGIKAINPATKEEIPIWVSDYVSADYGTGSIMAVPAHDERDFEFAKKYSLPITVVVLPYTRSIQTGTEPENIQKVEIENIKNEATYEGKGYLINSGQFNGLSGETAKWEITKFVGGKQELKYKLRDWVFSRQRYWGEPIPIIHCETCDIVAVPEKDLPVKLPPVKKYEPTGTGESPLAAIKNWVNVKCPQCGGLAKRETNTMPQWAGSSWYYLRYTDPKNNKQFASPEKLKHWLPVDVYFGGSEHTTLHLLYSRFWHQFLYDQKYVPTPEPYAKRVVHGLILGPDGEKMSKSQGNIVNPDEVVKQYGADALRMYELFLGPHEATVPWKTEGIVGVSRFLNRVWKLVRSGKWQVNSEKKDQNIDRILHKAIKKIGEDIENYRFNTGVSELMKLLNEFESQHLSLATSHLSLFTLLLSPFAPHLAEELWQNVLKHRTSVHLEPWPTYDPKLIIETRVDFVIQINGRTRAVMPLPADSDEAVARNAAEADERIKRHLAGPIKKVIFVKNKLLNLII